jgi:hypothetical protein
MIRKASNDVARKRVEEDLKKSAAQYADYTDVAKLGRYLLIGYNDKI